MGLLEAVCVSPFAKPCSAEMSVMCAGSHQRDEERLRVLILCIFDLFYKHSYFSSVQFSRSVVSDSLRPRGLQHARPPCPSSINSRSLLKFTSIRLVMPSNCLILCHPLLLPFPTSQFLTLGGQSIGVAASASVLPMNIQD